MLVVAPEIDGTRINGFPDLLRTRRFYSSFSFIKTKTVLFKSKFSKFKNSFKLRIHIRIDRLIIYIQNKFGACLMPVFHDSQILHVVFA